MSDDTPTQRFDAAGFDAAGEPDAPTELLASAEPTAGPAPTSDEPRSKRTIIILLAVGGALLLGILIVLLVLLLRGGSAPSPSPSPTASSATPSPTPTQTSPTPTPTPTPTETTPPPPPSPISTFTASQTSVDCTGVSSVTVQFSWAASGQSLWFGVGTDNAKAQPYDQYPLNYTLDFDYQCGQPSGQQKYTITVESAGGDLTSESIVITE